MKTNVNSRIVKVYNKNIVTDGEPVDVSRFILYPKLECGVNVLKLTQEIQEKIIDIINNTSENYFNLYIVPQNYEIGKEIIVEPNFIDWSKITNTSVVTLRILIAYTGLHYFGANVSKVTALNRTFSSTIQAINAPNTPLNGVYFGVNINVLS